MIKIINQNVMKKDIDLKYAVRIDRTSILGNPFRISPFKNQMEERDRACDRYEEYFNNIINRYSSGENLSDFDKAFIDELRRIYELSKVQDVYLSCWCIPKRCHGYTIMNFLNNKTKELFD